MAGEDRAERRARPRDGGDVTRASNPMDVVRQRLATLMRPDDIDPFLLGVLQEAGIPRLETPNDQLLVAEVLTRRKGALGVLGRALKIDALFAGATESPNNKPPR